MSEPTRSPLTGFARALATWWRTRGDLVQDGVLAAALLAVAFTPSLTGTGVVLGGPAQHPLGIPGTALVVAQTLPLAVRRRWPTLCLAVVAVAFAVFQLVGYISSLAETFGLFIALYSVGAHASHRRRGVAWAATVAYAALAITLALRDSPEQPAEWVTFYLLLAACWAAGGWVRARAALEAVRRRQSVELAMAAERARIARELHDVVTHHVTAMVVQADAIQFVLDTAPGRAADGLGAISGTGRRALAELRHLLGVLEFSGSGHDEGSGDAGRVPVAGSLTDLVAQIQSAGHPAELIQKGRPEPMAAGTQLAVYRVVQEALTNAMTHAPGCRTVAEVRYGDERIRIEVSNDGPILPTGSFTVGRGLTGLRERVSRCGGDLQATARPGGGFSVRAQLPRIPAQVEP